jgi:Cu/Ag efflux protein CusF
MRKSSLVAVALAAFLAAPVAFSADEAAPAHAKSHFDTAIDTWAEGVVMAIDADAGSLTIRGVKRPYATAYATMPTKPAA